MSWGDKSGWFFLGLGLLSVFHFHFVKAKEKELFEFRSKVKAMEGKMRFAMEAQEELNLRIASQNDPGWIEQVLMRDLGVVPEGYIKVHFKK